MLSSHQEGRVPFRICLWNQLELRSPALQMGFLPSEPPGKPKNTGVDSLSLLQEIFPTQGSNPGLPHLQVNSLLSESPGKPMNTGVDSLSLLQGIFLTQESNWGLLHYRRILYQLSYQRSPIVQLSCQNLAGMVRLQLVPGSQTPVRPARLLIGTEITILKCPLAS